MISGHGMTMKMKMSFSTRLLIPATAMMKGRTNLSPFSTRFSVEAPEGKRFLSRGRVFAEAENAELAAQPPIVGAQYAQGARPVRDGTLIVDRAEEACLLPGT